MSCCIHYAPPMSCHSAPIFLVTWCLPLPTLDSRLRGAAWRWYGHHVYAMASAFIDVLVWIHYFFAFARQDGFPNSSILFPFINKVYYPFTFISRQSTAPPLAALSTPAITIRSYISVVLVLETGFHCVVWLSLYRPGSKSQRYTRLCLPNAGINHPQLPTHSTLLLNPLSPIYVAQLLSGGLHWGMTPAVMP